ncbi:uncharacterized protein HD556DRAFT_1191868, partial [Suillus plorans]
ARSLYRCLFSLLHSPTPAPSLVWTAAYTNGLTPECLANDYVDRLALFAQNRRGVIPSAPLATFAMDDYTMFASGYGFGGNNLFFFLISRFEDSYALSDSFRPAQALTLALYDSHRLPDFPYTRASSSFSAVVQLYARSSQLDTTDLEVRHQRFRDTPPWCHFGCDACESVHDIFARCPAFLAICRAHGMQLCDETSSLLEGKPADRVREVLERAAQRLFSDDAGLW